MASAAVTLHVLELPACRLVHTHTLPGAYALRGLSPDPSGTALIVMGSFAARGPSPLSSSIVDDGTSSKVVVLPWPFPGQSLMDPLASHVDLLNHATITSAEALDGTFKAEAGCCLPAGSGVGLSQPGSARSLVASSSVRSSRMILSGITSDAGSRAVDSGRSCTIQ